MTTLASLNGRLHRLEVAIASRRRVHGARLQSLVIYGAHAQAQASHGTNIRPLYYLSLPQFPSRLANKMFISRLWTNGTCPRLP